VAAAMLLRLEKAGIDFIVADISNANRLTVGITGIFLSGLTFVALALRA
jgi:hypothetical protein